MANDLVPDLILQILSLLSEEKNDFLDVVKIW